MPRTRVPTPPAPSTPRAAVHQARGAGPDGSPRLAAQRRQLEALLPAQRVSLEDEEEPVQARAEPGGLPAGLQAGIAAMSGQDLSDVTVHRNSGAPRQLNALAYAQGSDIHLGPGQEQHLPHEAWHLVQQRQGRVQPTLQAQGVAINDDPALEQEADTMGARAAAAVQRQADPGAPAQLVGESVWQALRNGEFVCDRWKVMSGATANGKVYYIRTLAGEDAEVHTHPASQMVNIRDIGASTKTGYSRSGAYAMMVIAYLAECEHSGTDGVVDNSI